MLENRPDDIRGKSYAATSTANLKELLQAELDSEQDVDVEKVKAILAVLNERTEHKLADIDAAWDDLFHNHLPYEPLYPLPAETSASSKSSRKKHLFRIALVAAVIATLILGTTITAAATGHDIWHTIVTWTSETLGLDFGQAYNAPYKQNPELNDLWDALVADGITANLVPDYLPDGYTLSELYAESGQYVAFFQNGADDIIIQIRKIGKNTGQQYEQDSASLEEYTLNGITHYISSNLGLYFAIWQTGEYECSISGVPTKQELIAMIDSIYMEAS